MRVRRLGRSSLEVPVVSFGAWAIGGWYWGGSDDERALAALRAALDHGMGAVDTAPIYGFGRSERLVAQAVSRDTAMPVQASTWGHISPTWERATTPSGPTSMGVSTNGTHRVHIFGHDGR